jgi:CheY-specific phosphatase CheX
MTSDLTLQLRQAAISTFEQLGFLLADEEVSEEQAAAPITGSSRVRFRGPHSGALEIEIAGNFLTELANNMLGVEGDPPREVVLDALGEVSNVICGNVLPFLSGPNAVFDLSAPEPSTEPLPPNASSRGNVAKVSVGLDEGRAEVTLRLYG